MIQPLVGDILVRPYELGQEVPTGWTVSELGHHDAVPVMYQILTSPTMPAVNPEPDSLAVPDDTERIAGEPVQRYAARMRGKARACQFSRDRTEALLEAVRAEVANWAQDPEVGPLTAVRAIHDIVFPGRPHPDPLG